jgi:hypothetical protein
LKTISSENVRADMRAACVRTVGAQLTGATDLLRPLMNTLVGRGTSEGLGAQLLRRLAAHRRPQASST